MNDLGRGGWMKNRKVLFPPCLPPRIFIPGEGPSIFSPKKGHHFVSEGGQSKKIILGEEP